MGRRTVLALERSSDLGGGEEGREGGRGESEGGTLCPFPASMGYGIPPPPGLQLTQRSRPTGSRRERPRARRTFGSGMVCSRASASPRSWPPSCAIGAC